jgi:hypothetical protein
MSDTFDPYYEWLGIPPKDQPPHHYRLLGIELFETHLNVIERAADRQMSHLRTFQSGRNGRHSQDLLNKLSAAKICLLDPVRRAPYDAQLRAEIEAESLKEGPGKLTFDGTIGGESLPPVALPGAVDQPIAPVPLPAQPTTVQVRKAAPTPVVVAAQRTDRDRQSNSGDLKDFRPDHAPVRRVLERARQRAWWQKPIVLAVIAVAAIVVLVTFAILTRDKSPTHDAAPNEQALTSPRSAIDGTEYKGAFSKTDGVDSAGEAMDAATAQSPIASGPGPVETGPTTPLKLGSSELNVGEPPAAEESTSDAPSTPLNDNVASTMNGEAMKDPPPDAGALRNAERTLDTQYRDRIATAKSPAAKVHVAAVLFDDAVQQSDRAMQFALLAESRRLPVEALDPFLMLRVIHATSDRFRGDAWDMKTEAFQGLSGQARSNTERQRIAEMALEQAVDACAEEAFDAAGKLLVIARRSTDGTTKRLVSIQQRRLGQGKRLHQVSVQARQQLSASPDDSGANLALGKYLCFVREDWETGLLHLVRGAYTDLVDLATRDLAGSEIRSEQLECATDWAAWAQAAPAVERNGAFIRAQHWYRTALTGSAGPEKTRIEEQLKLLAEQITPHGGSDSTQLSFLDGPAGRVKQLRGHASAVIQLAVTRFGKYVVSADRNNTLRVWDLISGGEKSMIPVSVKGIRGLTLTSDNQFVIVGGNTRTLEIWRLGGSPVPPGIKVDGYTANLGAIQDGRHLFWAKAAEPPNNIHLLDIKSGVSKGQFSVPTPPTLFAYAPSGQLVAVSSPTNQVFVWKLAGGGQQAALDGLTESIRGVAISPDERYVAECSFLECIVWEVSTGREKCRLQASNDTFTHLAFSRDSRRLITSTQSPRLSLWDVEDGSRLQRITATSPASTTESLVVLPDSRGAITGDANGTIHVWRLGE